MNFRISNFSPPKKGTQPRKFHLQVFLHFPPNPSPPQKKKHQLLSCDVNNATKPLSYSAVASAKSPRLNFLLPSNRQASASEVPASPMARYPQFLFHPVLWLEVAPNIVVYVKQNKTKKRSQWHVYISLLAWFWEKQLYTDFDMFWWIFAPLALLETLSFLKLPNREDLWVYICKQAAKAISVALPVSFIGKVNSYYGCFLSDSKFQRPTPKGFDFFFWAMKVAYRYEPPAHN